MLEKFKRKKELANQDRKIPQTIQELIKRYDLDNNAIIEYLEYIVPLIVSKNGDTIDGDITLKNAHYLKGEDVNGILMYLIRAYIGLVAIGDGSKETRIWSSVKPTINIGGTLYTIATTDEVDEKVNKAGDTMSGDLHIGNNTKTTASQYYVENSSAKGSFNVNANGNTGIWSTTNNKWIIYMGTNGTGACNVNAVSATKATQDGNGLNIANNYMLKKNIARGHVTITPSAPNTPTSATVSWSTMDDTPSAVATPNVTVPGTIVLGCSVTGVSSTGATIWVTRSNTTNTNVNYVAVYK